MAAEKKEAVKTTYVVLQRIDIHTDDEGGREAWEVNGAVTATGPAAAKREALKQLNIQEGESVTVALVPSRSFQPATFEVEQTIRIKEVA